MQTDGRRGRKADERRVRVFVGQRRGDEVVNHATVTTHSVTRLREGGDDAMRTGWRPTHKPCSFRQHSVASRTIPVVAVVSSEGSKGSK